MEHDRIIEKIRKLLALADDGANIHESARAAEQAEKLMRKYQIANADVLAAELDASGIQDEEVRHSARSTPVWVGFIALGVARLNDCQVINTRGGVQFTGMVEDVEVASEMTRYLVRETDRLARRFPGTRGERGSFRRGCAGTLQRRMFDLAEDRKAEFQEASGGTALVVQKHSLIEQHTGRKQQTRRSSMREGAGYRDGQKAGAGMRLDRQVGGRNRSRIT